MFSSIHTLLSKIDLRPAEEIPSPFPIGCILSSLLLSKGIESSKGFEHFFKASAAFLFGNWSLPSASQVGYSIGRGIWGVIPTSWKVVAGALLLYQLWKIGKGESLQGVRVEANNRLTIHIHPSLLSQDKPLDPSVFSQPLPGKREGEILVLSQEELLKFLRQVLEERAAQHNLEPSQSGESPSLQEGILQERNSSCEKTS